MKILIETIPHAEQRYPTVGDWQWKSAQDIESLAAHLKQNEGHFNFEQVLHIRVSSMYDWRYIALTAVHELVEALLCSKAGITSEMVDAFDMNWQPVGEYQELGDDPSAPYHHQHRFASIVEELLAMELEVDWTTYAKEVNGL